MNRTQLHNPKHADQATLERAVRLLVESIGKDADPVSAVRSVLSTVCTNDIAAERDIADTLNQLEYLAFAIQTEAYRLWAAYTDAEMELQDNPDSLSMCSSTAGAGAGDEVSSSPSSLEALPPKVREHLGRRFGLLSAGDRRALRRLCEDGHGSLAAALVAEVGVRAAIASENADAALNCLVVEQAIADSKPLPLVRLGNRGYETEVN